MQLIEMIEYQSTASTMPLLPKIPLWPCKLTVDEVLISLFSAPILPDRCIPKEGKGTQY